VIAKQYKFSNSNIDQFFVLVLVVVVFVVVSFIVWLAGIGSACMHQKMMNHGFS
jgi:hypothetical protein